MEEGSSGNKDLRFFWGEKFMELWSGEPRVVGVVGHPERCASSHLIHQGSTKSLNHSKQRSTLPR